MTGEVVDPNAAPPAGPPPAYPPGQQAMQPTPTMGGAPTMIPGQAAAMGMGTYQQQNVTTTTTTTQYQVMLADGTMTTQIQTTTTTTVTQFSYSWYQQQGIDVSGLQQQNIMPGQANLYNQLTNAELQAQAGNMYSPQAYQQIQGDVYNYQGDYNAQNQRHGNGKAQMMDGSMYEGAWEYNLRHGMGTHHMMNGDVYKGEWSQGMKHGRGQLRKKKDGITITGTFEYGKASGLCVVTRNKDGKQQQELIVFKKGIQVAKNKKGVECGDIMLAMVSIILFILYFIGLPVVAGLFVLAPAFYGSMDGLIGLLVVALIIWCIWMCIAQNCSESASYIQNMQDFVECLEQIDQAIKSPPEIFWHIECYHYETRTRTVSDGNGGTRTETYEEKVVTHVANSKWKVKEWQDESAPIASLFYLQAMQLTRLHENLDIDFTEEAYGRYEIEQATWIRQNSRDVHNDFSENRGVAHFKEHTLVYNTHDGKLPWYANSRLLCMADAMFCGFIQRINLAQETYEVEYDLEKLILK